MECWTKPKPKTCEVCDEPIGETFVDGYTAKGWAIMCNDCHHREGIGFGIGKAQEFITGGDMPLVRGGASTEYQHPQDPED